MDFRRLPAMAYWGNSPRYRGGEVALAGGIRVRTIIQSLAILWGCVGHGFTNGCLSYWSFRTAVYQAPHWLNSTLINQDRDFKLFHFVSPFQVGTVGG